jgi:hypothetical protein
LWVSSFRFLDAIESVFQDRFDVAIRPGMGTVGSGASGFEPRIAIPLGKPQDAQARSVSLLGMRPIVQDGRYQRAG